MSKISVEIVTNYDPKITNTLESLRSQSFQDYNISVASDSPLIKDLVSEFDLKLVVSPNTGTLFRRIISHHNNNSQYAFLLEASRFLEKNCLKTLSSRTEDMVIIEEKDINNGFIAKIQNLERHQNIIKQTNFTPEYLISEPRYFESTLLDNIYKEISTIDHNVLSKIQFGDLDIIYYEGYLRSKSIGILNEEPLILHYTDENLPLLVKKYYAYGKSNKLIRFTKYKSKFKAKQHLRPLTITKESFMIYLLLSVKALSFAAGYYL